MFRDEARDLVTLVFNIEQHQMRRIALQAILHAREQLNECAFGSARGERVYDKDDLLHR
jgi:hypothetical protein